VGPSGQAGKRKRVRFGSRLKVSWAGSVGPTKLGSVRGSTRPAAQQAGSGSGLARRAGQPRLPVLRGRRVLGPDSFMGRWWAGGLLSFSSSSSLAGLLPLLFLLADRSAPRVSLGGIQCGGAWIQCGRWRARVRVGAVGVCVRQAPSGCSRKCLRDLAATSWPRCVVTAHGEAVAGSWRGDGDVARQGRTEAGTGRVGLCVCACS
jgi:hypothetical protein